MKLKAKERQMFLVQTLHDGETTNGMWSAGQILYYMDMIDCFEYDDFYVYDVSEVGKVTPLTLHGTWHDMSNPLYIKVTDPDGNIVFDGYGTDH